MTKRYLALILLLTLITSNIFFYRKYSTQADFIEKKTHKFNDAGVLLEVISSNYNTCKYYEQYPLEYDKKIITNKGDSILLKEVINSYKLIIVNSQLGCGACFESEISVLNKYISRIGYENIMIVNSNSNLRRLKLLKKQLDLNIDIYNNSGESLQIDSTNKLYCFITDSNLVVRDLHIPEKTYPKVSDDYYKLIIKKYFE